mgnify:CR=1 FL=1
MATERKQGNNKETKKLTRNHKNKIVVSPTNNLKKKLNKFYGVLHRDELLVNVGEQSKKYTILIGGDMWDTGIRNTSYGKIGVAKMEKLQISWARGNECYP